MSKKTSPPPFIEIKGLLMKRLDAPNPEPVMSTIWHVYVEETDAHTRYSPEADEVVEDVGPTSIVLEVMAKDRETALRSVGMLMERLSNSDFFRDKWGVRFEKVIRRLPYDKAIDYIKAGWAHADELIEKLRDRGVVVLDDSILSARTVEASTRGFTLEEAERIATDIGMNLGQVPWDAEQFRMGLDVELEHGKIHPETDVTNDNPLLTGKIAWAHLMEFPDYYDRLARMEAEGKEEDDGSQEPSTVSIVNVEDELDERPKFVSINGNVYKLAEEQQPEYIQVKGRRYRKATLDDTMRLANKWEKLPKGWTKESAKKFWDSLTGGKKTKHPVSKCIREIKKSHSDIDDPGAFCASLADLIEGPAWRHESRKKKKEARIDYMLPENHPQLPMKYNIPVKLDKGAAAYLQQFNQGQGDPVYALSSRLYAYGATLASLEELEAAVDVLTEHAASTPNWVLDELKRALVDARSQA